MLARIVVEIRAADIAVELQPYVAVYRDVFYAGNALVSPLHLLSVCISSRF